MKKVFGVILTLVLGLTLVACKKDDPKPPAELTDADIVAAAKTQLSLGSEEQLSNVQGNIELPGLVDVSGNDVEVTWEVKETGITVFVIEGSTGKVTRPEADEEPVSFTLVATLKFKEVVDTKDFALTVIPKPDVPVHKTIKAAIEAIEIPATGTIQAYVELITVIGKQTDGYFISDGQYSMYIHGGASSVKVGDTGLMLIGFSNYYGGYQGVGSETVFEGERTTKTETEIKEMAKDRTVNDFTKNYENMTTENLNTFKRDLELMGFFKVEAYVYSDDTIKAENHKVLIRDTDDTKGETNFIQSYYKSLIQQNLISLGSEEPKKMTIWASMQEIRDGLQEAAPGNKARDFVYRVTPLYMEVELTDADKVNIAKDAIDATVKGDFHLVEEGWTSKLNELTVDGVTITYDLKNQEQSTIFNPETLKVVELPDAPEKVILVATITSGELTETHEVEIIVGKPVEFTNLSDLKDIADGMYVLVKGTIKVAPKWDEKYENGEFTLVEGEAEALVYRLGIIHRELVDGIFAENGELQLIAKVGSYKETKQLVAEFFDLKAVE